MDASTTAGEREPGGGHVDRGPPRGRAPPRCPVGPPRRGTPPRRRKTGGGGADTSIVPPGVRSPSPGARPGSGRRGPASAGGGGGAGEKNRRSTRPANPIAPAP